MAELLLGAAASAAGSAAAGTAALGFIPVAGAAASASGALATGATLGLSSTVLGILQGLATATSVLGTLSGARAEQEGLLLQATQTDLEAGQQQLESQNRQVKMKRELLTVLGQNRVTAAAAGIDLQGGLAQSQEIEQKTAATREISIEREDDQFKRAMLRARASGLRSRARDAGTAGLFKAFGTVASAGIDFLERG